MLNHNSNNAITVATAATRGGYLLRLSDGFKKSINTIANLPNWSIRDAGMERSSGRGRKYTLRAAVIRYVKIIPVKMIFGIEDVIS
jgi:hypothetical protein